MEFDVIAVLPEQKVSRLRVSADSAAALSQLPALHGAVIVSAEAVRQIASQRAGKFQLPL